MAQPDPPVTPAAADFPPLSLYVHLPWCVRKCPYCDFNSHPAPDALPETAYVDALLRDLALELADADARPVTTVFFGGGTPSLFAPESIARILDALRERRRLAPDAEITLEANPGTADAGHFRGYREAGVNRLSLGVQSFHDDALRRLGRIHGGAEARHAVDLARRAGFDNLNLDLMFALPEQDPAAALADLTEACRLAPEHISWYQLTLEPNTAFHRHPPPLPDEDTAWDLFQRGQTLLADAGYTQYEVSAYARPGQQCRHNLNYWRYGDYLGVGAGAHGKLSRRQDDSIERRWKVRSPGRYLRTAGTPAAVAGRQTVAAEERAFEFFMNALRLTDGVAEAEFTARTGLTLADIARPLAAARAKGLLDPAEGRFRLSPLGRRFLDDTVALFLPEP